MVSIPFWPALLFWPAISAGLVMSCVGILGRRPSWLVGASILVFPASLYLTAAPRFRYVGLLPFVLVLLAAYAVRRQAIWLGGLCVDATVVFLSWVAFVLLIRF